MCGIAGIAARAPVPDRGVLGAMRDALRHRGPDDAGSWWSPDGCVGLGHRRLSILDLSPAGHQPMAAAGGRVQVVFNGEIYNFRELRDELRSAGHAFHSGSDTEVLLAAYLAWGTGCLPRLRGMFAFALWDAAERRLFLARDRAGEKPLFYRHTPEGISFGSELKALMADPRTPRELDPEGLEFYLAYGYVPGERCILRGVRKLPAAHAATWSADDGSLRVWRWWDLPTAAPDRDADPEALLDELDSLLGDAVRAQLVADVPVAVLLSGGIDSSLVTAMAARASSTPVSTFTVTFPGHAAFDESGQASRVARHFGTHHTALPVEPATVQILPELARQYDEPLADSSMLPTYLVSRLVRRQATVALGGDGGDELFGGYGHYGLIERQEQLRRVLPRPARALAGRVGAALPVGTRGRNHLVAFAGDLRDSIAGVNLYFDAATRRRLLGNRVDGPGAPEAYKGGLGAPASTALRQATAADFRAYLTDDILVKVDRASMLTSLEVRAPFLDPGVIEFAFGRVPDPLRATAGEQKVMLRRLAARLLPPELAAAPKRGFSLPLTAWFRGPWGAYVEEVLMDEGSLFDRGTVREMLEGQRRGLSNTHRLFALTLFELWRREYRVGVGGAAHAHAGPALSAA
jgi:asparagine synthase (glutamine-hydrolysing)